MSIDMTVENIIDKINHLLLSKDISSLFINGAPGSGKTYALKKIQTYLPSVLTKTELLGPYKISSVESLIDGIVASFNNRSMLRENVEKDPPLDLFLFWSTWANDYLCLSDNTKLIILIDLIEDEIQDLDDWRIIFSGIRNLELITNNFSSKLLVTITGYWDHTKLVNYYNKENFSFPYTENDNYMIWDGVTFDQYNEIIDSEIGSYIINPVHLPLLYEITSGHPGYLQDIILNLPQKNLTYQDILSACHISARNGVYAKKMINIWKDLPRNAHKVIENLLLFRTISYQTKHVDQLMVGGLIKPKQIGRDYYAEIKSFYVELILYFHKDELNLNSILSFNEYSTDIMPKIISNNFQAYKIIVELENLIRNILVVWLYKSKSKVDGHILEGRGYQYDPKRKEEVDAYERALDWRDRKTNTSPSPLISYLKIKDLSQLINEMGDEIDNKDLKQISEMVEKLADIRDLVMHNQLVGDDILSDLWDIRRAVYNTIFFSIETQFSEQN